MTARSLWSRLSDPVRLRVFVAAAVAAFGMSAWVTKTGIILRTGAAPLGIVSFELAGTPAVVQRIMAAWSDAGQAAARFNIRIDFLYLLAYGIALSVGCVVASGWWARRSQAVARLGAPMSVAMLIAAGSDALENLMMLSAMDDPVNALFPMLARAFALLKFGLLIMGLVYILTGAFTRIGTRRLGSSRG